MDFAHRLELWVCFSHGSWVSGREKSGLKKQSAVPGADSADGHGSWNRLGVYGPLLQRCTLPKCKSQTSKKNCARYQEIVWLVTAGSDRSAREQK